MNPTLRLTAAALALAAAAAPARAGGLGVRISAHGRHGGIAVQLGPAHGYGYGRGPVRTCQAPRYETRRVWVAGPRRRVWVPPVHEVRFDGCGRRYERVTAPGHWTWIEEPGHYETRTVLVSRAVPHNPIVAR